MSAAGLGLLGCGQRLRSLLERLPGLGDRIRITSVFDPDPGAIEAARPFLDSESRVASDWREVAADPRAAWVAIGSWNCHHREQAVAAFGAGKHVFCEKPLATTRRDCLAMREAWQASGRQFMIGFTLRYSPHYLKLFELVESGAIGRLVSMEFNETLEFNHGGYIMGGWRRLRSQAGTHLLEKCCHDIDLANGLTASLPIRVASFGGLDFFTSENARHMKRLEPGPASGDDPGGRLPYRSFAGFTGPDPFGNDKDIVDNQVAILEYARGVRASFHTNLNAALPERRMVLLGEEGAIRADVLTGSIEWRRIGFDTPVERIETGGRGQHGGGDDFLCRAWSESMLDGAPPPTGMEQALNAALTCFAVDEALDTGRVVDLRPMWQTCGIALEPGERPELKENNDPRNKET